MKAILFHTHGDVSVLEYADFPTPKPGPGEVLVRLKAAALNHLDLWVRAGWPELKLQYPHIPGADGAGEIAALGEGVRDWSVGDRVVINPNLSCGKCEFCLAGFDNRCLDWGLFGETQRGTYAEYIAVPERNLLALPEDFDEHRAAAAALVMLTAWHSLIRRGNMSAGETVLIIGASGGVNLACIQVAKLGGATVYVVGSQANKLALAESLGADYLINRAEVPDWSRELHLMTQKRGVDIIVDNVGTTFPQSFRAARRGGRILTVGNTGNPKIEIDNRYIFAKHLSLIGSSMGTHTDFKKVMKLVFVGRLDPVLDQTFPLSEAGAAQERLARGDQMGKITLAID
ncbi:MAG: zinc-binding dehydrogenase [Chloroflexota bacterium]|nr:MAG: zinc-binding dehydrogenase [Chloroflexota bacterium]